MKKFAFALFMILGIATFAVSCEADSVDEEIEILSPDKSKDEPIGGGNN